MTKKMSLLLTGMLLCLAPDIKGNETDGRIKGIVMDGELGGPLEFVTVQVKAKGGIYSYLFLYRLRGNF